MTPKREIKGKKKRLASTLLDSQLKPAAEENPASNI